MAADLVGKQYKDFELETEGGKKLVSEYVEGGKPVVLYIYANF